MENEKGWIHVLHLLLAGGIAGCATWASIFPLGKLCLILIVAALGQY